MFTRSTRHIRPVITALLVICGLMSSAYVQAGAADACFNFLNVQDYPRAENEAQALLKRIDLSREEQRSSWQCLGRAQRDQGRQQDSLSPFQQVERLSQTSGELAFAYDQLGATYRDLNDLDRAELYSQRALKVYRELGDKSAQATTLDNLALLARKRGDTESQLALLQEALAVEPYNEGKEKKLDELVTIYLGRRDFEQAVSASRQIVNIQRSRFSDHAAMSQIHLGHVLYLAGKFDEAENELAAGLKAIRLVGNKHGEAIGYSLRARLDESRGNNAKAKKWYRKAENLYREDGDSYNADQMRNAAAALGGK